MQKLYITVSECIYNVGVKCVWVCVCVFCVCVCVCVTVRPRVCVCLCHRWTSMDEMSRQIDAQARLLLVKGGGHGMQLSVSQAPTSLAISYLSVCVYMRSFYFLIFFLKVMFSFYPFYPVVEVNQTRARAPAIKHTPTHSHT